jgi:hypothetical protein
MKKIKQFNDFVNESNLEIQIERFVINSLKQGTRLVKTGVLNEGSVYKAQYELERLVNNAESQGGTPLIKEFIPEVMALVNKFADSGQSGGSAPFVSGVIVNVLKKLLSQEPLGGIENTEDEWDDLTRYGDTDSYQNKRLSSVFKDDKDGRPYYLYAITFRPLGKDYAFTGSASMSEGSEGKIGSSHYIKEFPFEPKTFTIDVHEKEYKKLEDGTLVEESGGGWWESWIADPNQLDEVWKYYDRKNTRK